MAQINLFSDLGTIAQTVQDDAIFIIREATLMPNLVKVFTDMDGGNTRTGYQYNNGTAKERGEADDLTSDAFTPSADQVLTPINIGEQFFITDLRARSEAPESILTDAAQELGFAAVSKVETDLLGELANLTGGTIGAAGTVITWGYLAAAIAQARNANKNAAKPIAGVLHGYQWSVLAKAATAAGATVAVAPGFQDKMTNSGGMVKVFDFMGVPFYQVYAAADSADDFTGGIFPREAIALDWRIPIHIAPERDESRAGLELNMHATYAHGVWRPARGVKMIFDATAPTS